MVKKILCALLVLMMAGLASVALAEYCEHGSEQSPCDIGWQVDHFGQQHRRVCTNHVEEKEDPFSYMPVTEWAACTPDADGECTTCGHDYIREPVEPEPLPEDELFIMMLEYYLSWCEENGVVPFQTSASGSKLTIQLSDEFLQFSDEMGFPVTETMLAKSTATLTLPDGMTYPATGKAVKPAVELSLSEYGPGETMWMIGMMSIGDVIYVNNVSPGTATVKMVISLMTGDVYTLQQNFTIEGQGPYCKYGSASSPCDIVWDAANRKHASFCKNHVEEKDDPYSYVQVTDWEDCTFRASEYICDTCGADYTPSGPSESDYEAMMVEIYYRLLERNGVPPLEIIFSEDHVSIKLGEQFIMCMLEERIPVTNELKEATVYTLTLPEGTEYPYEGRPVFPTATLDVSPNGPGAWLQRAGLLYNDSVQYENNQAPGTAMATMAIHVDGKAGMTLVAKYTIVGAVSGEYCIYGGPTSPCEIIWSVRSDERIHRRVCRTHREKEDYEQMIPVTDWEPCTPGEGGVCTGCGKDYDKSDNEMTEDDIMAYMVEYYARTAAEFGEAIRATVAGNELTFSMRDEYFGYLAESNVPVPQTMHGSITYTLVLTNGDEFAATGEPITPEVEVRATENGPGHWLEDVGLMEIGKPVYANNVEPGKATVSVTFEFTMGEPHTITAEFTILGEGPFCKYGSPSNPCDIRWDADRNEMKHRSVCVNHVEDKEDMYSYVVVTDWEDCNFFNDGYICDVCHADYTPKEEPDDGDFEAELLKLYNEMMEMQGRAPIYVEYSRASMTIEFKEQFIMYLLEHGIQLSESLSATTEYVFTLEGGDSYAYTGEEICPEVILTGNGVGPGAWLEKNDLIYIREVTYIDNIEPGQATVDVLFRLVGDGNLGFTLNFTITGEGGNASKVPGDADGDNAVSLDDALNLLRAIAGEDVSINNTNADVTGDGAVDLKDVLLILQYIAGWNVSLQ
ncbi:MAG: hypothetical protein E7318_07195 [Clostridiales bacterium]|nr:hypothetical protein [Clostridiales bacterium]